MGKFVKGDIVVIPFPFSDLSASKNRPALILADLPGNDVILCQITSQNKKDSLAIPLTPADLKTGALIKLSYIRPNKIFTADEMLIIRQVATVNDATYQKVVQAIWDLIK
jgi:mRNA interferase MazF